MALSDYEAVKFVEWNSGNNRRRWEIKLPEDEGYHPSNDTASTLITKNVVVCWIEDRKCDEKSHSRYLYFIEKDDMIEAAFEHYEGVCRRNYVKNVVLTTRAPLTIRDYGRILASIV